MDNYLDFQGSWRDGWVMYDGTIVVLYQKPGKNRDAYYMWRANTVGLSMKFVFCGSQDLKELSYFFFLALDMAHDRQLLG